MRDNFSRSTIEEIAKRAGNLCSNPECQLPTFGPKQGGAGFVNVGVAAHITAAAPKGPRYDRSLTSEQRQHQSNGIWLCQVHAKLIDSDEKAFSVETLRQWKATTEDRSFRKIVTLQIAQGQELAAASQIQEHIEFSKQFGLDAQADLESIAARLLNEAKTDLVKFKHQLRWPDHVIALNLRMADIDGMETFSVSGLAAALETFSQIVMIASPGRGKTTTLIQLVEAVLSLGKLVAVFLPLSEWSSHTDSFFQAILRRHAFTGTTENHLKVLAHHGRLSLVMDGWNELDAQAKKRARHSIEALLRDFPKLGIVVSTRVQARDVAIDGKVVEIDILSESQQLEIAHSLRGSEGEILLDHAWRTAGVNELVAIPLYLTALLTHASGGILPTTKEEVLGLFVNEHEKGPDKKEALQATTSGFHKRILTELAAEATRAATTTISDPKARATVKAVQDKLAEEGQIQLATAAQPAAVLDMLVSYYLLTRSATETKELSFQHQQFQEWYASFEVEDLMRSAASGHQLARDKLRAGVLNIPVWEEPILFACERVSRRDIQGVQAVTSAVLDTLGIDPLLASEMIYRSSSKVWEVIKDRIIAFVGRWHVSGRMDRAVHFMVNTGRSDFAPQIWPLISNVNSQIHLVALRAGRRFRPSVLGPQIHERIASLPELVREHIVSEIAHNSGMDGIELAAMLGRTDNSPRVQVSAIEALLFRRADRMAAEILRTAPDRVWKEVACNGHWEGMNDPDCAERLRREMQHYVMNEPDPLKRFRALLNLERDDGNPALGLEIAKLLEDKDFPVRNNESRSMINEAYRLHPSDVRVAILHRLQTGQDIPYGSRELLEQAGLEIDEGPIVDLALNPDTAEDILEAAVTIMGSQTAGKLIDAIISTYSIIVASEKPTDESNTEHYWKLSSLISKAGATPFFKAIVSRASTTDPTVIKVLAELVTRHHQDKPKGRKPLQGQLYEEMVIAVEHWGETLITNPSSTRDQLADVTGAIQRLASPKLVTILRRMLVEDLSRWKNARERAVAERKADQKVNSDSYHSYTNLYCAAFAAIGTKEVIELMKKYLPDAGYAGFGEDAAWVLKEIHERDKPTTKQEFLRWGIDFSEVNSNREDRQKGLSPEPSEPAEAILKVVKNFLPPGAGESNHRHALKLACVAFRMPYGNQTGIISELLALPLPLIEKRTLLAVLVQAGEIISADMVLDGIQSLIEEAKAKPWLLDENSGRLEGWLNLLPFTDRPTSTLDGLKLLDPNRRHPWKLRGLLSSLGYAPSIEAEHILRVFALEDARFLKEHEWYFALERRGTVSAALIFLDLMSNFEAVDSDGGIDSWSLIKKLSTHIKQYPELRVEAYRKFESLAPGNGKTLIGGAIAEAPDENGVITLLLGHASADTVHAAVRNVAEGTPLPKLRKELFTIAFANSPESSMARACLNTIDEIRDDYGSIESEPRHPDIVSGRPWPPEANLEDINVFS